MPEFVWQREVVIDGVVFKVRNTPCSFGTKKALQNGKYELSERQLLKREIKPGDVIIEMGAPLVYSPLSWCSRQAIPGR